MGHYDFAYERDEDILIEKRRKERIESKKKIDAALKEHGVAEVLIRIKEGRL